MTTVFISIDWFHPAYKAGGPVQSIANMVQNTADGFCYRIFCSNKDVDGAVLNVQPDCWIKYNDVTEVFYASGKHQAKKQMQAEIDSSKANVLFINGLYSWNFSIKPLVFCKAPRKIVSVRGMLHPGALTQKKWKKKLYLFLLKLSGALRNSEFHVTTEEEKNYVQKHFGRNAKVYVVPNFPRQFSQQESKEKNRRELNIVSVGLIGPMKNHLLVLQSLEIVTAQIRYDIYGAVKDEVYWEECKNVIRKLPSNITVNYHGDVPPLKVEEALSGGHVFVLPSKSENFGHAIFEALSAGKPVITSKHTPWNNLKLKRAGCNISIEDKRELAGAISFFAQMSGDELAKWSSAANEYAMQAIDIDKIKMEYREMFGSAVEMAGKSFKVTTVHD